MKNMKECLIELDISTCKKAKVKGLLRKSELTQMMICLWEKIKYGQCSDTY